MKKLLSIVLLSSSLVNASSDWVKPAADWAVCAAVPVACEVARRWTCEPCEAKRSPADDKDAAESRPTPLSKACDLLGEGSRCALVGRAFDYKVKGSACLDPKEMVVDSVVNTGVICCTREVTKRMPKEVRSMMDRCTETEVGRMLFVNVCNSVCKAALSSVLPAAVSAPVKK